MTYTVTLTNGTVLTTIPDATVDDTTSLNLIGRNFAGYGDYIAENFVHSLENFSNTSAPSAPLVGQIWYNSSAQALEFWSGSDWIMFGYPASGLTTVSVGVQNVGFILKNTSAPANEQTWRLSVSDSSPYIGLLVFEALNDDGSVRETVPLQLTPVPGPTGPTGPTGATGSSVIPHGSVLLTATTSSTYVVPANVYALNYLMVGGGGGGGATASTSSSQVAVAPGGNGATWAQGTLVVTPAQNITYHCGTGGAGGTSGGSGQTGNNTVFGSITAYGGHGGYGVGAAVPPVVQAPATPSNVASGGVVNGGETSGAPGISGAGLNNAMGGVGGQGPWGGCGGGSTNSAGQNGSAPGAGGGGGSAYPSSAGFGGGNGAAGAILLWW